MDRLAFRTRGKGRLWRGKHRRRRVKGAILGKANNSNLGIGVIFFALGLVGLVPLVGFVIGGSLAIIAGIIIVAVYWLCLAVLASAVSGVLLTALYRYATTGKMSEYYSEQVLKNPWNL